METKKKVGRPPSDKSTPEIRAWWREDKRKRREKKKKEASESIAPQVEDGEH